MKEDTRLLLLDTHRHTHECKCGKKYECFDLGCKEIEEALCDDCAGDPLGELKSDELWEQRFRS